MHGTVALRPNNSFKPNLLRYINNMADKACHVVASATQVGLIQALGLVMQPSPQFITSIRRAGAVLLAVGALPLAWALYKFESLPNYLRLGALVPFAFGVLMFCVNDYFDGWTLLGPRQKGRALAWLFIPFGLLAGAFWWYLNAPGAKA